jgi:hypothetical protein
MTQDRYISRYIGDAMNPIQGYKYLYFRMEVGAPNISLLGFFLESMDCPSD